MEAAPAGHRLCHLWRFLWVFRQRHPVESVLHNIEIIQRELPVDVLEFTHA